MFKNTWDSLESTLLQFLTEEYKNGNKGHSTSNMLEVEKWDKFDVAFSFEGIPAKVLLDNIYFNFSSEYAGDVFVFNVNKAKRQLIGTFNMGDDGKVCYLHSYQIDNFDPLTSIVNFAWMISNQARRYNEAKNQNIL